MIQKNTISLLLPIGHQQCWVLPKYHPLLEMPLSEQGVDLPLSCRVHREEREFQLRGLTKAIPPNQVVIYAGGVDAWGSFACTVRWRCLRTHPGCTHMSVWMTLWVLLHHSYRDPEGPGVANDDLTQVQRWIWLFLAWMIGQLKRPSEEWTQGDVQR